jgi:hypothetical protein
LLTPAFSETDRTDTGAEKDPWMMGLSGEEENSKDLTANITKSYKG